ncbi:hypothetical protein CIB48_g10405 [Xylaria polymorpha]|nr:hypothetical protein CIB48_g10405 [Xylaria polymorpha]
MGDASQPANRHLLATTATPPLKPTQARLSHRTLKRIWRNFTTRPSPQTTTTTDNPETANSQRPTPFTMSTSKVKTGQLWNKSKDDLIKQLGELKTELGQLRIQKITSSGSKLNKIHDLRKSIARVLTVVNLKQRQQLRLFYKNKKYLPLDLRPKQTRAIRRRLSPEDKSKTLEKTKKRATHFPQRKYAVKAA